MKVTIAKKLMLIEQLKEKIKNNEKINLSELERTFGITRKTIRKYRDKILGNKDFELEQRKYKKPKISVIIKHQDFINSRINHYNSKSINGSKPSMYAIYSVFKEYLVNEEKTNFKDVSKLVSFSTFRKYLSEKHNYTSFKTKTPRICVKESLPGEFIEIDWKENVIISLRNGKQVKFNILVAKLPFSRKISLHLTFDRKTQSTLKMIIFALVKLKGVPRTLICDNMKTIIEKNRGSNKDPILNKDFVDFTKDFNINIKPCTPYTPQQKGKVESIMRVVNRLKAYSGLIDDPFELVKILKIIEEEYNNSISDANGLVPNMIFEKAEQSTLQKLPHKELINSYLNTKEFRTVKKDCSVSFLSNKFYVSPEYIEKDVVIWKEKETIFISYNNKIIKEYDGVVVLKHKFVDLDTQVEILKYEYEMMGYEIDMDKIIEIAKRTLKSIDIQYKLKKSINIKQYDKFL